MVYVSLVQMAFSTVVAMNNGIRPIVSLYSNTKANNRDIVEAWNIEI